MTDSANNPPNPTNDSMEAPKVFPAIMHVNTPILPLFRESIVLVAQNFSMVYPIFLYFLLFSIALPKVIPNMTHWSWWLLMAGLLALWFVFQAGWHSAMAIAVKEWLAVYPSEYQPKPPTDPPSLSEPFQRSIRLFKETYYGIGDYALVFIVAGFIWMGFTLFLPLQTGQWAGETFVGIPKTIAQVYSHPDMTQHQLQQLVAHMSVFEMKQWTSWFFIYFSIGTAVVIINSFLMFWPQFLILRQCNPFKALLLSIKQAWHNILPALLFSVFYLSLIFVLLFFSMASPFTAFFANIFFIISILQFGFLLFLYLMRSYGPPQTT